MSDIKSKTNAELGEFISECEEKYQKLLKLANKLANEMDTLSIAYNEAKTEIAERRKGENVSETNNSKE